MQVKGHGTCLGKVMCQCDQVWIKSIELGVRYEFLNLYQILTGNDPLMTFDPLAEHTLYAPTKDKLHD